MGRTCAPLRRASPRKVACGLASAPVGQPAPHQPSWITGARPLYSGLLTPSAPRGAVRADGRPKARHPDLGMAKGLERRHRVRLARWTPALFGLGVARDADLARDAVI